MGSCKLVGVMLLVGCAWARPQEEAQTAAPKEPEYKPMPYDYSYKVEDAKNSVYFGKEEAGNEGGRVEGNYYVWLPDGRLMTVAYHVDGDSGFVPKITYTDNYRPEFAATPSPPAAEPVTTL